MSAFKEATGELVDIIVSLTAITQEETDGLLSPGPRDDAGELAAAKARLVALLDARIGRMTRKKPEWLAELEPDPRAELTRAIGELTEASQANGQVLKRQIDLSTEMMAAVAAEAQRLTGARNATYGMRGALSRSDQATPISLNARL